MEANAQCEWVDVDTIVDTTQTTLSMQGAQQIVAAVAVLWGAAFVVRTLRKLLARDI
jgi:hypothetical protein